MSDKFDPARVSDKFDPTKVPDKFDLHTGCQTNQLCCPPGSLLSFARQNSEMKHCPPAKVQICWKYQKLNVKKLKDSQKYIFSNGDIINLARHEYSQKYIFSLNISKTRYFQKVTPKIFLKPNIFRWWLPLLADDGAGHNEPGWLGEILILNFLVIFDFEVRYI